MATVPIPQATDKKIAQNLWRVAILLGISVFINYLDRGSLSIAAPLLKDELHLSASQLGILLSSFFWTYACFQLVSGWLVDHFDVTWVMAGGFVLWSAAMSVTGALHAFGWLLGARLVLGAGESVCFPSYSKILARHFPEEQRGLANSVIIFGVAAGPAFSMFVGGMAMARFGWRSFFYANGLLSLVWLVPWFAWRPRAEIAIASQPKGAGWREILRQRSAWGTFAALCCTNYLSYFLLTWMPSYLRDRNFSMEQTTKIAGGCYLCAAFAALFCGWLADRWIARGASPSRVRKGFTGTGMTLAAGSLMGCVASGGALSIVMLVLATVGYGICCSNMWAITQTLAGPAAAGRWTGMQNGLANLAGGAAPAVTGFVLQRTGNFFWAFAITAVMSLLGTGCWMFVVGPIEPVVWKLQPE